MRFQFITHRLCGKELTIYKSFAGQPMQAYIECLIINHKINSMGIPEILIIAVAILVLFGAKRIPALMKGLGKGINDFNEEKNKSLSKEKEEDDDL